MEPKLNSLIIINEEISSEAFVSYLLKEINDIDTSVLLKESLKFDKWDWIVVGISSLLASLSDLVLGRPSGFKEPHLKNDALFGIGKKINQYEMKNNPIDFQDLQSFGGDHRLYSYGHDLLRFFEGVRQTMIGEYRGISSGISGEVVKQFINYDSISWEKAILINLLHLLKDFCTAKSLPLPGMTILASLHNDKMPKFAEQLYDNGVNVRTMSAQAISVAVIELTIRVYHFLRLYGQAVDKELRDEKLRKMLLLSHSIAATFNIGKVIVTKNPFLLNTAQFVLILKYVYQAINKQMADFKKRVENKETQIVFTGEYLALSSLLVVEYSSIERAYNEIIATNEHMIAKYAEIVDANNRIIAGSSEQNAKFDDIHRQLTRKQRN